MTDGDGPPAADPIVVTLASIAFGTCAGGAILIASTFVVRTLQTGPSDAPTPLHAGVLTAGIVLGIGTAITLTFRSTRSIRDTWRRGVAGAIAMFGTAVISLIALPLEMAAGRMGLGLLFAATIGGAIRAARVARNARSNR